MTNSTIGQAAARSGFTTSALRFYERVGLAPAARTPAGYRIYDDRAVTRLEFIARAKQASCTLEEIKDLVAIWDDQRCGPVQRRFHELVTAKLHAGQARIGELTRLVAQLRAIADRLDTDPVNGACDDGCACHTATAATGDETEPDAVPIACSLDGPGIAERVADWADALSAAGPRSALPGGGLRLELADGANLATVTQLMVAEQRCCPFFAFALTVDQRGAALEVRAPDGADDAVTALFGSPDQSVSADDA